MREADGGEVNALLKAGEHRKYVIGSNYLINIQHIQVTCRVSFKTPTFPTTRDKPLHSPQGLVFYIA